MTLGTTPTSLNPAQTRVIVELMKNGQPRPSFDPDLAVDLRSRLEESLAPLVEGEFSARDGPPGDDPEPLWVNKGALGQVHACESHFLSELEEPFSWNPRNAKGTLVHKALELAISSRTPVPPLELIDHAIDRLIADDHRSSPGSWLKMASELELADLRARANETVVKFFECWPPLKQEWSPRTETRIAAELCAGRVVLRGSVDLALGQARGNEARVLIVDLKTGGSYPNHLDDLRFYALIQTLRVGVPPFRIASYYLDTATFHPEDVTTNTLEIAVRRTIDGVRKMVEITGDSRPPTISPGTTCSWCRLRDECEGALTTAADW